MERLKPSAMQQRQSFKHKWISWRIVSRRIVLHGKAGDVYEQGKILAARQLVNTGRKEKNNGCNRICC